MNTKLADTPADAEGKTTKFTGRGMILGAPVPIQSPLAQRAVRDKKE